MRIAAQYLINSSILHLRKRIEDGKKLVNLAEYLCNDTLERIAYFSPASLSPSALPDNHLTDQQLKQYASRVKSFGASGSRTTEQAQAAAAHTEKIVKNLPTNSIQIWTDGSKLGKGTEGPTGAGALILRTGEETPLYELINYLGISTNQTAELWAIGSALTTLAEKKQLHTTEVHIFTDSQHSINVLTNVYKSIKHFFIVKRILSLIGPNKKKRINFHHVAGHADIPGNEAADALAKQGANHSSKDNEILDLKAILELQGFNFLLINNTYSTGSTDNTCRTCTTCTTCTTCKKVGKTEESINTRNTDITCNSTNTCEQPAGGE
jgi:ribonuclease HI